MCYMTIISTTSDLDLSKFNSNDLVFDKEMPGVPEEDLLKYPYRWFVGSAQGCSCGFRHLMSQNFKDLGFAEPQDWFHEEPEDIEATLKLVSCFNKIASGGSGLECIDAWVSDDTKGRGLSGNVVVSLSEITQASFRLIENYHHEIRI